jgi:PHD/YefM family antitoxin component YafN of YafNO toxin-antitoxin module
MGQARPARTIEAEVFLLKDVNGSVKAKLDVKDGSTKLMFLDRAGHERVVLTSAEDFSAFEMKDENGRLGAPGAKTIGTSILTA